MTGTTSFVDPGLARRFRRVSRAASGAVSVLGASVLLGWILDLDALKSLHPSLASMKPNTALCFALMGGALWLEQEEGASAGRRRAAALLAALCGVIAGATLIQYAASWNFGIDQMLIRDPAAPAPGAHPGRMSPATAFHFVLLAGALLLFDVGSPGGGPAEWIAILVGLSSLLALLGYVYDVRALYQIGPFASIALHTAIAFVASCTAVLFARPERGLMRLVAADSPGGMVARRFLPAAVVVPSALGWLRLFATRHGIIEFEFGLALFVASIIVCFAGLVMINAGALARADRARAAAEAAVRESEADLAITLDSIGDGVVATDAGGRIVRMNPVAEELCGWSEVEARGRNLDEVVRTIHEETREAIVTPFDRRLLPEKLAAVSHAALVARDGSERIIADRCAPIRDGDGGLRGAVLVLRDQTEERRAARALRESEARKAAILDAAVDCIVTMDHRGAIVEFNRAAEKTFRYARAEAIGRPLAELLIPPALRERHRRGLQRHLTQGAGEIVGNRIELPAMRADGSEFPAELTIVRIHSDGPPMFTGYIRDITERRSAAEALRASEARFRRLVESGLIGIVVASADGAIQDANEAFLRMVGFGRDALESGSLSWGDLAPPESREVELALRAMRDQPIDGPAARSWEQELLCRGGPRVPVLLGLTRLDDTRTIAFVLDQTERRRAEAAVVTLRRERAADAKFRALLEAAPDAMVIADPDGRIALVNGQTERLFGYAREEVMGRPVGMLIVGGSLDLDRREVVLTELRGRRKDGGEFPIEVSLSPIETEEGLLLSSAIRDVSQRKQAEERLGRAKQEAENAMGELEAFSYSVAHDLRTPLRSINGFSRALLDDYGGDLHPEAVDYLRRIMAGAERMGQLIDALLSLARVSRADVERERVDLTRLARTVVARLRARQPTRAVEIAVQDGLVTQGDPQLLRVLVENLLGNAWKFSARREGARIEFGCTADDPAVYYVSDNGAGFDMAYADKLFVPFQRLHAVGEFVGTGIGLATAERIVRRHGGRIWAEAELNRGATFRFTLPDPARS